MKKRFNDIMILTLIVSFIIMLLFIGFIVMVLKISLKDIFIQGEVLVGLLILVPTIVSMVLDKAKSDTEEREHIYEHIKLTNDEINKLSEYLERYVDDSAKNILDKEKINRNFINLNKERINSILINLNNKIDIYNDLYEKVNELHDRYALQLKNYFNYNLINLIFDRCINTLYMLDDIEIYKENTNMQCLTFIEDDHPSLINSIKKSYLIRELEPLDIITKSIHKNFYDIEININDIKRTTKNESIKIDNKIFYKCKFILEHEEVLKFIQLTNIVFIDCKFDDALTFKELLNDLKKRGDINVIENDKANDEYIKEDGSIERNSSEKENIINIKDKIDRIKEDFFKRLFEENATLTRHKKYIFLDEFKKDENIYVTWSKTYPTIEKTGEYQENFKWSGWHSFINERIKDFEYFIFAQDIQDEESNTVRVDLFIFEKNKLEKLFTIKNQSSDGEFYDFYLSKNEFENDKIKAYDFKDKINVTEYCEVISIKSNNE